MFRLIRFVPIAVGRTNRCHTRKVPGKTVRAIDSKDPPVDIGDCKGLICNY